MTQNFLKELEEKGLVPVDSSPYVGLLEENPVLFDGLNLCDFYGLVSFAAEFSREKTRHTTIQHRGRLIESKEDFGKIYTGSRRKLAELIDREEFRGGLKPLELFLVFEYFALQKRGQGSGNLQVSSKHAVYPHVNFLWECGLADYVNQVDAEDKVHILGNESQFYVTESDLAKIVLANERNPLPMRNSLQFLHTHAKGGTIKEDDSTFNRIGIPQVYLDYLRKTFELVPMDHAIWNGNAQLFSYLSGMAGEFHSYTDRFADFLNQFDKFKWE